MKLTVCLSGIALLLICVQKIEAREPYTNEIIIEEELCQKYALVKSEHELRDIRDVWNKIKESAIQTGNYIKGVAEDIKAKIQVWVEKAEEYANKIKDDFEEKLDQLKNNINDILKELYGTGELVKQCAEKEKENIDAFLKTIMLNMIECISDAIKKLPNPNAIPQITFDETNFKKELDEKVEFCERDMENIQECLFKAREDILGNFTTMEQDIIKSHFETRSLVDDIKSTLVTCSTNNIINATYFIAQEVAEIFNCMKELKNKEDNLYGIYNFY